MNFWIIVIMIHQGEPVGQTEDRRLQQCDVLASWHQHSLFHFGWTVSNQSREKPDGRRNTMVSSSHVTPVTKQTDWSDHILKNIYYFTYYIDISITISFMCLESQNITVTILYTFEFIIFHFILHRFVFHVTRLTMIPRLCMVKTNDCTICCDTNTMTHHHVAGQQPWWTTLTSSLVIGRKGKPV